MTMKDLTPIMMMVKVVVVLQAPILRNDVGGRLHLAGVTAATAQKRRNGAVALMAREPCVMPAACTMQN